jgi:hypothetical protein
VDDAGQYGVYVVGKMMTMTWVAFFSGAAVVAFIGFIWMCFLDWQEMKRQEGKMKTCKDCVQYDDSKLFEPPCKHRPENETEHICFMFREKEVKGGE